MDLRFFPLSRASQSNRPQRRCGGFTLVEVGLVLLALGLAIYIAVSEVKKIQHRAQRDRWVEDLQALAAAFETYRAKKGDWPPATSVEAAVPAGMESALADTAWGKGTPFGGSYEWIPPVRTKIEDREAGKAPASGGTIALTAFSPSPPLELTDEDLRYIDRALDDGNLATGRFRTGFNGWPTYLVNPKR